MRAVVFSLNTEQVQKLLIAEGDRQVHLVAEEIEEEWDKDHLVELDKAWDAMERCFALKGLGRPFSEAKQLHKGSSRIISLLNSSSLNELLAKLEKLTHSEFQELFVHMGLSKDYEGPGDEDDLEYTWSYFQELREFYRTAHQQGRATLFTVYL